ncbi:MAG: hypothetical protein NC184_05255 [Roseburia sp.]|nr:hypothetical protein [Roseburia sp.]
MENKGILEQIKVKGLRRFKAVSVIYNETYRCYIEDDGNIFVYAHNKKRSGWRFDEDRFLMRYTPIMPTDENLQWKNRLNRAVKLCRESGLWTDIAVVWDNLYKYVTLDEKKKIHDMSWDNRDTAITYCKERYPFMIKTDNRGRDYLDTDYIWELSRCELKSMYFGYNNAEEKEKIRTAISEHREYTIPRIRTNYDVSFSYNPDSNKAFYSEEYKNCGNGHYYLALNHSTAVFCEDD